MPYLDKEKQREANRKWREENKEKISEYNQLNKEKRREYNKKWREGKKVKNYAHMGTGNYNETTSKLYTDIGLMTSNKSYTKDALKFFNVITGHSIPEDYENLLTAPIYMRDKIISYIEKEIKNVKNGIDGKICIKINSLQDKTVISKLYDASNVGVKICLIVRGICCLRPGRKNLSENIQVIST